MGILNYKPRKALPTILFLLVLVGLYRHVRNSGSGRLRGGPAELLNSTLGFQQIFVVNLAERTDRRDSMTLAAAVSGLNLTFLAGVHGDDVPEKVLPPNNRDHNMNWSRRTGSWRAHMNVLQRIVDENITTALIMEDDADWDVRLRSQVELFAFASRAFLQPKTGTTSRTWADSFPASALRSKSFVVDIVNAPVTVLPKVSPYGDDWDVLWMGHVGSHLPSEWQAFQKDEDQKQEPRSLLTVVIKDDETVPTTTQLRRHPFAGHVDTWAEDFPPHTRVVHESRLTAGIQAYAVTQRGARRLLYQFGLMTFTGTYDLQLSSWCDGAFYDERIPHDRPICLTTQPPIIGQYYGSGGSDIYGLGGGYAHKTGSAYIRYSVMANLHRLVLGDDVQSYGTLEGLKDQWPDDAKGLW